MTWNLQTVWTYAFCFCLFSFLAIHFAHMKTPTQFREIASHHSVVKPAYDASWKY
jgi:hypothetical protein